MIYLFQNDYNSPILWNYVLSETHCYTPVQVNTLLQMTFFTENELSLCHLSFILRIWILCLHLTSAGFICFKVTRLAYMQSNASDPDTVWNSFLMIYLLTSTIRSALGEAWNLKGSLYLFEYSFTPSSKFLTVNTRVRNQANLSPRTWSKRCDSQWKQNIMFFYLLFHVKF